MNKPADWTVPKWPFLAANAALIVFAAVVILWAAHPISQTAAILATATVAIGAFAGCLPFILEYRATARLIEVNALGKVSEKLDGLEAYATQIAAATDQWARVQEVTRGSAEQTATAAREIAGRMETEVREFNEFQARMNDTEKAALRLEGDKLRRAEADWLQVVARILDHIFALHNAAVRSGQPELAGQIGNFQHACRDAARRVGLIQLEVAPGEKFDGERHRVHGEENPPGDSSVAEMLAPGLSFQGRLIRPALVRLQEKTTAEPTATAPETPGSAETTGTETAENPEPGQLPLEQD